MSDIFDDPRWNRYDEKRKYRRLIAWTSDNAKHLPADYIPSLIAKYGKNKALIKAHIFGEFCPMYEGNAYANYIPSKHDINDRDLDPMRELDLCFDFNANPVAWTAIQTFRTTPRIGIRSYLACGIMHEAEYGNTQLDDAIAEFVAKVPVERYRFMQINIYGDRSGHATSHKTPGSDYDTIYKLLKQAGFTNVHIQASRQVAPETASVDATNRLFLEDLLFVCMRCKLTKKSFQATTWKQGARKLDKPSGETWSHHSDSVKYWAWQRVKDLLALGQKQIYGVNR